MGAQGLWWPRLHTPESGRATGAKAAPQHSLAFALCPAHIQQQQQQGQWLHTHPELSQTCLFHGAAQQTAWAPASLELSGPNQEPTAQRALQHLGRVVTPEAVPVRFYLSSLQVPCCTHVQPCSSAGSCKAFLTSSQFSLCPQRSAWMVD